MHIVESILSPFVFVIKQVFLISYNLTGNYGLSIILLSFFISALLLPIFILIEKVKKKNDAVKQKMKPLFEEIKRCYKGQERYYYIKTLNRQHNYSPLKALIPILSLLLQIPFFIAAYQYLEHFDPLNGVRFLFIKDLSKPDGLLGIINILPIAMTIVNLVTAWFYTRNGNASERKKMVVVAGIFLVLLFRLPSGLVLYWTMNNVFSFFRLFITNPEVFRRIEKAHREKVINFSRLKTRLIPLIPRFKNAFFILTIIAIFTQINWAFQHNFNDILFRIIISAVISFGVVVITGFLIILYRAYKEEVLKIKLQPVVFYSLLFLTIYFCLAGKFYFSNVNTKLYAISFVILIPLQLFGFLYIIKPVKYKNQFFVYTGWFLLLIIFIFQVFNLSVYLFGNEINIDFFNINILIAQSSLFNVIYPGILFSLVIIPFYIQEHPVSISNAPKYHWLIYFLAIVYIVGLIFFWNPLSVYSTSPETFDFPAINIFKNNFELFLKNFIWPFILYLFLPKKIKNIWLFIVLMIVATAFVFSSLIPINLGSLQESRFSEQEKLAAPIVRYIIESVVIIGIFPGIKWLYRKQNVKSITGALIILNLFLIGQSLYSVIKTGFFFKTGKKNQHSELDSQQSNKELKPIPFSKSQKNIIYFVADGFQGWFINKIIEDDPELKEIYEGFTWYPNCISMSNYTHSSLPSMFLGYDFSVDKMNEDLEHSIKEKMHSASRSFIQKVKSYGYYYSSESNHYTNFEDNIVDNYIPYWMNSWGVYKNDIHLGIFYEIWYKRLYENAIFNCVPLFIKPKIYNNTKWLAYYNKNAPTNLIYNKYYNFVRLLPFISNSNSDQSNFLYIHNGATHNPWNFVTESGKLITNVSPYKNNKWFIEQFSKWIIWMKENGVYDNTKIILISDHGPSWREYNGKPNFKSPMVINKDDPNKVPKRQFWRLNVLLLIKDFGAQGSLKEDWRLMSNADAPAIVFDQNNPAKGDTISRSLPTYWTSWVSKMIENKTMEVNKHFIVTDNMFDLKNWKRIK